MRQLMEPGQIFPRLIITSTLLGFLALPGFAQDNIGDESTILYPAEYFQEFAPITALDMVNRIPGVNVRGGGGPSGGPANASRGGRGLGGGAGGIEILINGKRTAGKNNNSRISWPALQPRKLSALKSFVARVATSMSGAAPRSPILCCLKRSILRPCRTR